MDFMKLREFMTVGVPETFIVLLIGLSIGLGRKFYKKINLLIPKFIVSILLILLGIFFARGRLSSTQALTIFCLILYILNYRYIFEMNIRKAIVAGCIGMLTITSVELITLPALSLMMDGIYFDSRFSATLMTRIVQIITLGIILIFNMSLGNIRIFAEKWRDLKNSEKVNFIFLSLLLILCIIFNSSYVDMNLKLNMSGIKISSVNILINMAIYFFENILFIGITFYLLYRTKRYHVYEQFLNKGDKEIFIDLLAMANERTIKEYIEMSNLWLEEKEKIRKEVNKGEN